MKVLGKTRRAVLIATQGFAKLSGEPSGNQVRILAGFELLAVVLPSVSRTGTPARPVSVTTPSSNV